MDEIKQREIKICVLGGKNVGKRSFCIRFMDFTFGDDFIDHYSKEEEINKKIKYNDHVYLIDLYRIIPKKGINHLLSNEKDVNYIKNSDGAIFIYSIADYSSFEDAHSLYRLFVSIKNDNNFPVLFLGNKLDLKENERQVTDVDGFELSRTIQNCKFCEYSLKSKENVEDLIEYFIEFYNEKLKPKELKILKGKNDRIFKSSCYDVDGFSFIGK